MNMKKEYKYCILASISMVGSILITIYTSVLTGDAIDYATVGNVEKLLRACGIIFVGTILSNVWFVFSVWLNECFKKRVVIRLRDVFAKELLKRPLSVFRRKEDAYYINIYSNDMDRLGTNYYEMLALEWKFLSLIAGAVIAMTVIQPGLLVISLVFALLPVLAGYLFEKGNQKKVKRSSECSEKLQAELMQYVQGIEMLKLNSADAEVISGKLNAVSEENGKAKTAENMWESVTYTTIDTISMICQLALIGVGGFWIIQGKITAGQLVSCTMLSQYLCSGINNFLQMNIRRRASKPIKEKVFGELKGSEHISETGKPPESATSDEQQPCIVYDKVSFSYENTTIMDNRSLCFEEGKSYAIVGESGRGKSTMLKLLLKYVDNYYGNIYLYGKNIRDYSDEELYSLVGMLNQNEAMLNASIRDNITLFREIEDMTLYNEIVEKLNISELIRKAENRCIGDFGDRISGGEKQRIALARVLLRNTKILILDEPVTGLDSENKAIINNYIFGRKDVTKIVVTHDTEEEYLSKFDEVIRL